MKIFTSEQVHFLDNYTIANEPISAIDLMERASLRCSNWLLKHFSREHKFIVFAGFGNNGGDGLAIARHLLLHDYKVDVFLIGFSNKKSNETQFNLQRLQQTANASICSLETESDFPIINEEDVVLDAMFGSGLNRPLNGIFSSIIGYLNNCRAFKIAIDIPSGLHAEETAELQNSAVFRAQHTLTFESPFISFFLPECSDYVGKWHILPIGIHTSAIRDTQTNFYYTESKNITIAERKEFSHKGTFGHALLLAGSYGMCGASILASKACLKCGCGLVTVHTPKKNVGNIHTSFPEAIVSVDQSKEYLSELPALEKYKAIAIGPGIGFNEKTQLLLAQLIESVNLPVIIDADALTILSLKPYLINKLKPKSVLTPHIGEFDRLFGASVNDFQRVQKQMELSKQHKIIIVLKGRHTSITFPDGTCHFNPTGNNGMATAGSGDVLTGMLLSLMAQGYPPEQAALNAVYLHGLAGDIALNDRVSKESLLASDIIDNIGKSFNTLKQQRND